MDVKRTLFILCEKSKANFYQIHFSTADRICTTSRFETECTQLQRGNSEVACEPVQDSIECALKIRNG